MMSLYNFDWTFLLLSEFGVQKLSSDREKKRIMFKDSNTMKHFWSFFSVLKCKEKRGRKRGQKKKKKKNRSSFRKEDRTVNTKELCAFIAESTAPKKKEERRRGHDCINHTKDDSSRTTFDALTRRERQRCHPLRVLSSRLRRSPRR